MHPLYATFARIVAELVHPHHQPLDLRTVAEMEAWKMGIRSCSRALSSAAKEVDPSFDVVAFQAAIDAPTQSIGLHAAPAAPAYQQPGAYPQQAPTPGYGHPPQPVVSAPPPLIHPAPTQAGPPPAIHQPIPDGVAHHVPMQHRAKGYVDLETPGEEVPGEHGPSERAIPNGGAGARMLEGAPPAPVED